MASAAAAAGGGYTNGMRGKFNRLFHVGIGIEIGVLPLYTDTPKTSDVKANSSTSAAAGLGPRFELAFWPLVTPWVSVGLTAIGRVGALAEPGGGDVFVDAMGQGRLQAGLDRMIAGLFRFGYGYRLANHSADAGGGIIDASDSGSISHEVSEIGGGLHICTSRSTKNDAFCDWNLNLWYGVYLFAGFRIVSLDDFSRW